MKYKLILTHLAALALGYAASKFVNEDRSLSAGPAIIAKAPDPAPAKAAEQASPSRRLSHLEPQFVLKSIQTPIGVNRRSAFQGVLNSIQTFAEAKAVYDILVDEERNGRRNHDLKMALLERAGAVSGQQFAELLTPSDPAAIPDVGLGAVMRGWASIEPAKAVAWVNDAKGSFKLLLSTALIEGTGATNPDYARQTFSALPPPAQAAAISPMIDIEARAGGLPALEAWCDKYIAEVESRKYPQHINEDMTNEAFEQVASRMVKGDRNDALVWLAKQWDDGKFTSGLLARTPEYARDLVGRWVADDPDDLGHWLSKNRNSAAYDRLAEQFALNIAAMDTAAAEAWVDTIRNPEIQSAAKKQVEFRKAFSELTTKQPMPVPE